MKASTLNICFLIAGLIGLPICLHAWQRSHRNPWLLGIGIFAYFLISSLRESLLKYRGR